MSEFKDLQPEVCDTIEIEAPPKICPTCKPDPSYIEPTWWQTDEVYLNKKICEYQVNIVTTKKVSGLSQNEIKYEAQKMVKKGIRTILRQVGKLETNEIVCAFPPKKKKQKCKLYLPPNLVIKLETEDKDNLEILDNIVYNKKDPENRFNPDSIEVAARVADIYYGDNFEVFQVLVSVPAENIDTLPEAPFSNDEQEELEAEAESVKEVELDGLAFKSNIRRMQAAFLLYGKYQTAFAYTQNIKLTQYIDSTYRPFYIDRYRGRLSAFSKELIKATKKIGLAIRNISTRDSVGKIKITFKKDDPLKIKAIFVKKDGCQYERLRDIEKLKQTDKTTLNYIVKLEEMIEELSFSGEDVPWLDFLAEHTFPALEINFGDVDNNDEPLDSCIDQSSVENLKDNVLKGLLSFSEVIQFTLSTHECKSLEEIIESEEERQRFNLKESLQKNKQKRKTNRANRQQKRNDVKDLKDSVDKLESNVENLTDEQALKNEIEKLQQSKFTLSKGGEKDDKKQIMLKIKINKSIISKLNSRLKSLDGLSQIDLANTLLNQVSSLEEQNEQLEEEKKELQDQRKEDRQANRKKARKLTYSKLKDMISDAYDSNRKEMGLIEMIRSYKGQDRTGFILNSLNPCKWDGVSLQVIECLLGGMSFAEALPLIIKAALKNANPYVLENLLIGLPMEERKKVSDKVKKELSKISQDLAENFKEPWEAQREKEKEEENVDSSADKEKILEENPPEKITKTDYKEAKKNIRDNKKELRPKKKKLKELQESLANLQETYDRLSKLPSGNANIIFKVSDLKLEIDLKKMDIEVLEKEIQELESKIEGIVKEVKEGRKKSTTPELANVANIIIDAYVDAITDLLSIDRLTELIDKIPGANIFKKLLIELTCPRVNTFKNGISDLFGSLSIEFCDEEAKNFFLPAIPDLPKFKKIGVSLAIELMLEKFKEALRDLIAQLVLALIIRILDLIENGLCNSIGVLGALLANAITGQKGKSNFMDAVNDAFCENEDAREDTTNDLLGRTGIPTGKRLEIANALSSAATTNEIKKALVSDCDDQNPKVMKAIWAVINASDLNLNGLLQTPDDVRDMFCMMGSYLTDEQKERVKDSLTEDDLPVNSAICLTNEERENWDNNRRKFYEDQGLDPNAAKDFVDGLNKKMNNDLSDMLDSLAKGPEGLLEEALAEALAPRDPGCDDATNSIMPPMPNELKEIMDQIAEGVFGSLAFSFTRDMFGGAKSFFENVLADQRGIRLSYGVFSHERRVGSDLLFPNAANSVEDHDFEFDENAGPIKRVWMKAADRGVGRPDATHIFPETVGIHLNEKFLEQIEKDISFTKEKKKNGRKVPDLTLKFRNKYPDDEDLEFDFGFNLEYRHFRYTDKYVKSDEFSLRKIDISKTTDSTSRSVDMHVKANHGVNSFPDQLEKYDVSENNLSMPYTSQLFVNVLKDRYSKASATGLTNATSYMAYLSLNNMIYKKMVKALSTDERNLNNLPVGYLFGYKDDKITYEDLLYVDPEATGNKKTWEYTYEEEDGILGKSATGNKRVKFLDPAVYGGRYTKPKLYVEPAKHDGWFRIAQTIVPEIDGCEPRRSDFLFIDDITKKVTEIESSIKVDKRSRIDPSCLYEPAYDKLMSPSSHAYIEGIIAATVRAYTLEAILRCMPVISHLKLDFDTNYSDLFSSFIIGKMEDTMQEQGTWPRRIRDYKYWICFLEQVVQSSYRMLERGDLPKDEELIDLLKQAVKVSKSYTRPTLHDKRILAMAKDYKLNQQGEIIDCTFQTVVNNELKLIKIPDKQKARSIKHLNALSYEAYGKDYKKELLKIDKKTLKITTIDLEVLKEAERQYDIHENVKLAKKILKFHVMRQLRFYGDKLELAFTPQTYINNLSKFLLGASKIPIVSNTKAGLSEIESPVGGSSLPNYGKIPSVPDNNESPFTNLSEEQVAEARLSGGLFLQKYIRVIKKEDPDQTNGGESAIGIEGMVSFNQFRTAIGNYTGDKTKYISDILGDAVAIPELNTYEGTTGVKMGVRVCYLLPIGIDPFASQEELLGASKAVKADKAYFTNDPNGLNYFVPLAHFEQDIIDRTISEINLDDDDFDEDIKCYFDKMVETDEFKFIFESLLITNKVSSLMAIYCYDGFINSIGFGDEEREEGKEGTNKNIIGLQVGWEGKILDGTKKRLLDLFSSYYLANSSDRESRERMRRNRGQFLKNLFPASIFNFDKDVRWWQLRRLQDRPFDKDGKDCANTLADIFKGGK